MLLGKIGKFAARMNTESPGIEHGDMRESVEDNFSEEEQEYALSQSIEVWKRNITIQLRSINFS